MSKPKPRRRPAITYQSDLATLWCGDCREVLPTLEPCSVDAVVTDPPYHLTSGKKGGSGVASRNPNSPGGRSRIGTGFMGKAWDGGDVSLRPEVWEQVLRVARPGAHLLAFGGTRTFHRLACAIEDAGWEIRDCVMWVYGSGFPKSLDVSKAIDKSAGAERKILAEGKPVKRMIPGADQNATGSWIKDDGREFVPTVSVPATDAARQWGGWGTALKPAWEPIYLARKPLIGTVAENVLEHGTGGINVDGCRVKCDGKNPSAARRESARKTGNAPGRPGEYGQTIKNRISAGTYMADHPGENLGRWPANVVHDGSDEVLAGFPQTTSGKLQSHHGTGTSGLGIIQPRKKYDGEWGGDTGSAARFFYCAKASRRDRGDGNTHPTVKPASLMQWLCRLITPPNGLILDPFVGSGSTGLAAMREGYRFFGIDSELSYCRIAGKRLEQIRRCNREKEQGKA